MAELLISNLVRKYGLVNAVDDISVTVGDGEFLTLLGPSGCGKSTTLFCISGLDSPTSGTIRLGKQALFDGGSALPPEKRDIGLVFQSYALWPHMTVRENLAFPLKLRRLAQNVQKSRIEEILALVEMSDYAERYPFELSGGQQQRVALARALVYQPKLLLLDEPLSNLDAKLRERARVWLRQIQKQLNVTTIYVTHDQSEALAISDRIAVMQGGKICQLGTPLEVYESPSSEFVADFIGSSNFLDGEVIGFEGDMTIIRLGGGEVLQSEGRNGTVGAKVSMAIKPERVKLRQQGGSNVIPVAIRTQSFLGSIYQYEVSYGNGTMMRVHTEQPITDSQNAHLMIPTTSMRVFMR